MKSSVVLLSAGLDSTVNLLQALRETTVKMVITFDYGQRAAEQEISRARKLCEKHQLPHRVVDLSFFQKFSQKSGLVGRDSKIPQKDLVDISSMEKSFKTADMVWVPNRNGIFLNIAAGFAEGLGADMIIPGFNAEEAATFPDNTREYAQALDQAFAFSTQNQVKVVCYTQEMQKPEIVRWGLEMGLDLNALWPCYFGGEQWCGECESCQRFDRARRAAGVL